MLKEQNKWIETYKGSGWWEFHYSFESFMIQLQSDKKYHAYLTTGMEQEYIPVVYENMHNTLEEAKLACKTYLEETKKSIEKALKEIEK